mgnify:CR=1 FL=1
MINVLKIKKGQILNILVHTARLVKILAALTHSSFYATKLEYVNKKKESDTFLDRRPQGITHSSKIKLHPISRPYEVALYDNTNKNCLPHGGITHL